MSAHPTELPIIESSPEKFDDDEATPYWAKIAMPEDTCTDTLVASCKHTGCIDFQFHDKTTGEFDGFFHICNLDEFIERLQALRRTTKEIWKP